MIRFIHIGTKARLLLGFALLAGVLAIVIITRLQAIMETDRYRTIEVAATTIQNDFNEARAAVLATYLVNDPEKNLALLSESHENVKRGYLYIALIRELAKNDRQIIAVLDQLESPYRAFIAYQGATTA